MRWATWLMTVLLFTAAARGQQAATANAPGIPAQTPFAAGAIDFAPPPPPVAAKTLAFPFSENAGTFDNICIPVRIAGKDHYFSIETRQNFVMIDGKLADALGSSFGEPVEREQIAGPYGKQDIAVYHSLPLEANGVRLLNQKENVGATRLYNGYATKGQLVEGLLGMSVLANYVVRLDFRKHQVELIDPAGFVPPQGVKSYDLLFDKGVPKIFAPILGVDDVALAIDTGHINNGEVTPDVLKRMPKQFVCDPDPRLNPDPTGIARRIRGKWSLAGATFENICVGTYNESWIGLGILSRYVTTLDFAHNKCYLESIQDQPAAPKPLEFPMREGVGRGDLLCITLRIAGKDYLFGIDTGFSGTLAIDPALAPDIAKILGPQIGTKPYQAINGQAVDLKYFLAPPIEAAGRPFPIFHGLVQTVDLRTVREAVGTPIVGIVGMGAMQLYGVQLDFRRRVLRMIDSSAVQPPAGEKIASLDTLIGEDQGLVTNVPFLAGRHASVLIDSGFDNDGSMGDATFNAIPRAAMTEFSMQRMSQTAAGAMASREFRIKSDWRIGGTDFPDVVFSKSDQDVIGLNILSNFVVTFDFPGYRTYLESIRPTHVPSPPPSPINLVLRDGKCIVRHVNDNPGVKGLHEGDELLAVDGKPIEGRELWQVREQLIHARNPVLKFRHDRRDDEVTLPWEP